MISFREDKYDREHIDYLREYYKKELSWKYINNSDIIRLSITNHYNDIITKETRERMKKDNKNVISR